MGHRQFFVPKEFRTTFCALIRRAFVSEPRRTAGPSAALGMTNLRVGASREDLLLVWRRPRWRACVYFGYCLNEGL
jgi:hypothetical protein